MRIIVTGGAGFLGSHLTEGLLNCGHCITVVDDLSTGLVTNVPPGVRLIKADVSKSLVDVFGDVSAEVVIHLAAQVSVPDSVHDPLRDLDVNVGGTINVVRAASKTRVRKIITVSSAAVYGVPTCLPLTEDSPTLALSPYGLSKLTSERYVRMLCDDWGIAYTIIRPANIYGPRQATRGEGAVVPAFLTSFLQGRDPVIHGNGGQTRDFIYVTDAVGAIIRTLQYGDGFAFNISSGVPTSVIALWRMLADLTAWNKPPVFGSTRAGDIPHSVMANKRAVQSLRWEPVVGVRDGLARTVAWYKEAVATATNS